MKRESRKREWITEDLVALSVATERTLALSATLAQLRNIANRNRARVGDSALSKSPFCFKVGGMSEFVVPVLTVVQTNSRSNRVKPCLSER